MLKIRTEEVEKHSVLEEVIDGLHKNQKQLPSKLFYDERGSALFDKICELEEYYPTKTEMQIMQENIDEIGSLLGEGTMLIELGSGSSKKIRLLLDHIPGLAGYIPIDISAEHLEKSALALKKDYPKLDIFPLAADYTRAFNLPIIEKPFDHKAVYYPGSTIGNFVPNRAKRFLQRIAKICGNNGGLVIGVDLKKDRETLEKAYNDRKGVTAEFNLNMLRRINKELNANFDLNNFYHNAIYDQFRGRIEMHLVSRKKQKVNINSAEITFDEGEFILTEYSYKYSLNEFAELVRGDFDVKKVWTDKNKLFSIQYLRVK